MTPRQLLKETAAAFRAAGIPDPEVDASVLLSSLTGVAPLTLRLDGDTALADDVLARFSALVQQRLERIPLQYLLGSQDFMGHSFHVDERVLIPRPETELLCELAIDALRKTRKPFPAALDLCCGSGCIGVSIALAVRNTQVHLADLSEDALAVTRMNAEALHAAVTLHQGDLFGAVDGMRFDVIVSNPPYIPTEECRVLQDEVLREPVMALDGGMTGLDFYRRIAQEAPEHLLPGGMLLLEVGWDQGESVRQLLKDAGFTDTAVHRDYNDIGRMVTGRWMTEQHHD